MSLIEAYKHFEKMAAIYNATADCKVKQSPDLTEWQRQQVEKARREYTHIFLKTWVDYSKNEKTPLKS